MSVEQSPVESYSFGEEGKRNSATSLGKRAQEEPEKGISYEEAWSLSASKLRRKCLQWMSGEVDSAEEAFSRAGLLAFEKYPRQGEGVRDPGAWLSRLTYNICMDLHRELGRRRNWEVSAPETVDSARVQICGRDVTNPERLYLLGEQQVFIEHSVRSLPVKLREVMMPLFFEGCTYSEIAERLAITEMALRKRVQEARCRIRRSLSRYINGEVVLSLLGLQRQEGCRGVNEPRLKSRDPWSRLKPVAEASVRANVCGRPRDVVLTFEEVLTSASERRLWSLQSYLEKHPGGWKKRLEIARLFSQLGRFLEAETHYRQVIERQPRELSSHLELAEILLVSDRRDEAVSVYQRALDPVRRQSTCEHLHGLIARAQKRWDEAGRALKEAARLEPDNVMHWIVLGETYLEARWPIEAVAACESAHTIEPNDPFVLTLCHDAFDAADRPLAAASMIMAAVESPGVNGLPSTPTVSQHFSAIGRFLDRQARAGHAGGQKCRNLLRRLISLAPLCAETHRSRARQHLAQGEWGKAEQCLGEFVAANPMHARGCLYHGQVLQQIGDDRSASVRIQQALDFDANDREIRCAHIELAFRFGPAQKALQALEETLELFPDDAAVVRLLAEMLARGWPSAKAQGCGRSMADHGRVWDLLAHATRLQPQLSESAFCRGRVLAHFGRFAEAIASFEEGWSLLAADGASPSSTSAALNLSQCWRLLGDMHLSHHWALAAAEQAEAFRPCDPAVAESMRGGALAALGEDSGAYKAYQAALRLHLFYPQRRRVESLVIGLIEEQSRGN